jgi:predicted transcriptional regulator of viral defense system
MRMTVTGREALDHLAESAGPRDGYFTRADARAAGAGEAILEALLDEHAIETISTDVYHLVQFPRTDREELITLWLQTDRQGVFSHETALLLHELSDILPRRQHIMVPPGFDVGARQFDASVELLRGDVADAEKCWIGPVPYTSALRTLRDCIDIGVSPDLIEQAIEEGLERGLFTVAEIPVALRAKSA